MKSPSRDLYNSWLRAYIFYWNKCMHMYRRRERCCRYYFDWFILVHLLWVANFNTVQVSIRHAWGFGEAVASREWGYEWKSSINIIIFSKQRITFLPINHIFEWRIIFSNHIINFLGLSHSFERNNSLSVFKYYFSAINNRRQKFAFIEKRKFQTKKS